MLRVFAIAATIALALPTLAMAQGGPPPPGKGHPAPRKMGPHPGPAMGPHGPMRPGPRVVIHPGPMGHPGPMHAMGHGPGPWMFHGHSYAWHPVHFPRPWVYPPGYAYRLWAVGAILPPLFWREPTYYYTDWASMGLPPPDPGFQYVEYGPDLLLVNVATGEVVQVFPGAFS